MSEIDRKFCLLLLISHFGLRGLSEMTESFVFWAGQGGVVGLWGGLGAGSGPLGWAWVWAGLGWAWSGLGWVGLGLCGLGLCTI